MAAYAALVSVMQIVEQLQRHPSPPISINNQQVESLTQNVTLFQKFLEDYNSPHSDSDEADPLEMCIADAAYAAEDVIESYIVDEIQLRRSTSTQHGGTEFLEDCDYPDSYSIEANAAYATEDVIVDAIQPRRSTSTQHQEINSCWSRFFSFCRGESSLEMGNADVDVEGEESRRQKSFYQDPPHSYNVEADPLEMRIADAAYAAEDVIESYIVDEIQLRRSTSTQHQQINFCRGESSLEMGNADVDVEGEESRRGKSFYQDLQRVIEDMDLIKKTVMEMREEKSITAVEAQQPPQKNFSFTEKMKNKSTMMVGFDDVFLQLLDKLTGGLVYRQVIPITGMGGIGKTTLARKIFENARIKEYFDICAWVTISQQYSTREIISKILSQVIGKKSEECNKSGEELYKNLYGRRYLIIMDDIWSIDVWEKMKFILGDNNNGSRIIVTTRQSYLTSHLTDSFCLDMEFLDELNSWNLFSKTVFGEDNFPPQLEKIGNKIVKICKGLPLSIVVIGGLLAKSEHSQKYWEQIELKLNSIVNSENDKYCLRILKMSYKHLPAYLKPIFLYMGIFEEDTEIRVSTLIKLWVSEGFLKPEIGKSFETIGKGFLKDLIDRNLILIDELGSIGDIKFCKIHDLLRDLCLKEAEKERFYHVVGQHSPQGIHNGRRVFDPRRSSNDDALECMSHVRSVTSLYHGVRELPNLRLLRILNAYDMYGKYYPEYRLENVIHELVNSRYLSICVTSPNTEFPAAVNFLWNLQTLRVCSRVWEQVLAPVEIWKMSQLRHVEFISRDMHLPDPPSDDIDTVILENLETLKGVRNFTFGEKVINRIPNIKRLKIIYETILYRRHDGDYYCVSNLEFLQKLESFTCVMEEGSDVFLHNITFPHSLKKLSLELFDSPIGWEDMLEQIGSLPLLQKLKLRGGYFKTHKLETVEGQFPSLKSLTLEFCGGLEQWMMEESSHFPCLEHLTLFLLQELEEIPAAIGEIPTLQSIKLYNCSDSVVKSAKKIVEEQEELQGEELSFHVEVDISIYHMGKEALKSLENPNFKVNIVG